MGTYLDKAKQRYEGYRSQIAELAKKADDENRALTEDEFRSVNDLAAKAQTEFDQITALNDQEVRNAKVGELAATLTAGDGSGGEKGSDGGEAGTRSASGTTTQPRDPGHYRSIKDRGDRSWFTDVFEAGRNRNAAAIQRLAENTQFVRAAGPVTQSSGGVGLVPPKWLADEYIKMPRQGRVLANLVRRIPLGEDPRPLILPKQTAQVDADLTNQTAEGTNNAGWGDPLFATDKDTLTPNAAAAYQDVSRQLLAAGTPSADVLIMTDLHDAWDLKVEKLVATTISSAAAVVTTFATNTLFNTDAAGIDAVVDAQTAVGEALYGPADIAAMTYWAFGNFRKMKDGNNRPLMPVSRYNPQNATGALGNVLVGDIEGVDAYATNGAVRSTNTETIIVMRSQALLLAESDLMEFNYDQIVGPSSVRMGIFGYMGALARVAAAMKAIVITDATQ